ncbi:MAG: hypothetical protein ACLGSD_03975 [Acidobacteriota bacterium]
MIRFIPNVCAPERGLGKFCASVRRRWFLTAWLPCVFAAMCAHAQAVPAGSLLVTVSAASKLTFAFVNASGAGSPGYCSLGGAGTSTASLNLGTASIASDDQTCVTFTPASTGKNYTLANTVYVNVTQTGGTSTSYTLAAALPSTPTTGVKWTADGKVLATTKKNLITSGVYGANTGVSLSVTVQYSVATGSLGQTIDFTATAN